MVYKVSVQGIEVAQFPLKSIAEWFISKLKQGHDVELNTYITKIINSEYFQDCEITLTSFNPE